MSGGWTYQCHGCGDVLPYSGRGRPPKWCRRCRSDEIAAKKRAYYERNREEIVAKKRAYRERNRDEIAAKQRAYRERNRTCAECGERMRHPSESGLCGFCEEERAT